MVNKIKKGFDLYLYYWAIPFFILCIFANHFIPHYNSETINIGLMVSVVSFLFGFLITISFSMILNKVSLLKESLATETGRLVSLFLLSKNLGVKFHKKITDLIDTYTITTLRHYSTYAFGRESIYEINKSVGEMEIKNDKQKAIADSFLYILGELEPTREKLEYLTSVRILRSIKFTNHALAIILIGLLFLNRGEIFTEILFVVLSTVIVLILLIIEDYENLKIGDYVVNISNSEQLFDLIGRDRYYPKPALGKVKLKKGREYRIGFYNSKTKTEEIVTLQYTSGFSFKLQNLFDKFKKRNTI